MDQIRQKIIVAFELFDQGKLQDAEKLYDECLAELTGRRSSEYKQVLHGIGYVKAHLNKFIEAREAYRELLLLAEEEQDKEEQAVALHQLGMVERMAGNLDEAFAYFQQEHQRIEDIEENKHLMLAANYYEQGYLHLLKNEKALAENLMNQSLDHAKLSGDQIAIACAYRGLGELHLKSSERKQARNFLQQAIRYFKKGNDFQAIKEIEMLLEN